MSQWGEIEDINLVRDKDTGRFKGFGFVKRDDGNADNTDACLDSCAAASCVLYSAICWSSEGT